MKKNRGEENLLPVSKSESDELFACGGDGGGGRMGFREILGKS